MSSQSQPARSDQSSFNIKEFVFKYLRFLPLFILSVALAITAAFLYLRYTTPIYRSTSALIMKDEGSKSSDKFEELFVDDRSKNIAGEIEYLKSRPLMERVVDSLDLNFTYKAKGQIRESNVYRDAPFYVEVLSLKDSAISFTLPIHFQNPGTFTVGKDKTPHWFGRAFKTPYGTFQLIRTKMLEPHEEYNISWQPTPAAADNYLSTLAVAPKQAAGILTLSIETEHAQLSADILNTLMKVYQVATIEDKNIKTLQTLKFLDGRLRLVESEYDDITNQLVAFQKANNMTDVESQSGDYFAKAAENDRALTEQRTQQTTLDLIESYVSQNSYNLVPSTLGLNDATLGGLVNAYNLQQLERKALLDSNIPVDNPRVKQKEESIERVRRSLLENIRNLRRALNASMSDVARRNSAVTSQIRALPSKQQNLIEIKRKQENKLAIYNFLMEKREESAISLAATISNIKILDRATANQTPVKPNHRQVQMIALIVGLLIPALFIFLKELMDDKISTRTDIEKVTTTTIIGEVGHANGESTLIVTAKNRSFVAEQFRIIRTNLQYVLTRTSNPVIMVTSSFSGEGKSFICTNLGAVMALAGRRTIVLEFDIRKPKILAGLKIAKKPGLINYLLGKASAEELPVKVDQIENLYILPCGPIPPNPSEILLEPKLAELFAWLKENFDVIVMDTPPVGMVGDALTLAQFADCTLYVVRQGVTHKKQLELVDEFHREGKLPKLSVVLNDIKLRAGYGYYGYGRYGYGSTKTYGYYDDEKDSPSFMGRWFGWMSLGKNGEQKKKQKVE